LERLRPRGFGKKRSLALREFALGMRHCSGLWSASLHAEYECAFADLALEREPADPRL
jgi:protein phosphatase